MGDKVGRVALFGIPLQQTVVVRQLRRLRADLLPRRPTRRSTTTRSPTRTSRWRTGRSPKAEQARFDPMITGFNPADMYAADHIRRVLTTFPGVFSGIGEFTIHKEFVSSKIAGETASLTNPALDRILDFAGEVGLVVLLHNDIDMPFPKPGAGAAYLAQLRDAVQAPSRRRRSSGRTSGLGRVVQPGEGPARRSSSGMLADPDARPRLLRHLVGRGREVRRRDARRRSRHVADADQPLSRPLPVRHRRGRADRPGAVPHGLRHVRSRCGRR